MADCPPEWSFVSPSPSAPAADRRVWLDLLGLVVVVGLAGAGYFFGDRLLAKADRTVYPPADCHINLESCTAMLPGGQVELTVAPRPVPLQKPFRANVLIQGVAAKKVDIEFTGAEMNMGVNRVALTAGEGGLFSTEATIPVCVTGPMNWRATVIVETANEIIAIPYIFQTGL